MKSAFLLAPVSALALLAAMPALAQSELIGITAIDDKIEDIEKDVTDDMARSEDAARFGSPEFRPGLSGSASLGYSGKTGNNESQEFSLGLRLRYAAGPFVQTIGAALDFADVAGVKTKEDIFVVYDANYYMNDSFYVFGLARLQQDGLASTALDTHRDGFVGVGPGYRIVNSASIAWRLQAGIGISYLEDGVGTSVTETGYLAGSRFFYKISDAVFLTNDTDVLSSDTALRVNNDLGVNFKLTDTISTRMSYLSEYNDSRAIRTDNKVGLSIVFGF